MPASQGGWRRATPPWPAGSAHSRNACWPRMSRWPTSPRASRKRSTLPDALPHRPQIIDATFAVVLVTIVVQGAPDEVARGSGLVTYEGTGAGLDLVARKLRTMAGVEAAAVFGRGESASLRHGGAHGEVRAPR